MTGTGVTSDIPLPEFPALAELAAQGGGATGHPVLDAVLAGVRERAGETVVAYYDDAP